MLRVLLRLMLLLTVLFALMIGLIRSQPYTPDEELRAFITPPEGCRAPCWQGIRPGVTGVHDALGLLGENSWIAAVNIPDAFNSRTLNGEIYWRWSGEQPAFIDTTRTGRIIVRSGIVETLIMPTELPLGDALAALGRPQAHGFLYTSSEWIRLYAAAYQQATLIVSNVVVCPLSYHQLWQQPSTFTLSAVGNFVPFGASAQQPFCLHRDL